MSPSGAEFIRQIKEPDRRGRSRRRRRASLGNGAVIVDVRETRRVRRRATSPAPSTCPRGYLESRIEGAAPDRDQRVILYCASGNRSALAAHTLADELGYEHVESMTGGITLWKDRGYEVEVPQVAHHRAARALLAPPPDPRGRRSRASRSCSTPRCCCSAPAASARRPRSTSRRPASARSASSTTTWSTSPTSSARSSTPPTASACRRSTPPRRRSTALNPDVEVVKYQTRLDASNIMEIIQGYDIIVDGVDNFPTRYLLNDASVRLRHPGRLGRDPRLRGPALGLRALRGPVLPLPLSAAAAGRARAVLRRQRRPRRAARHDGPAPGDRGHQARSSAQGEPLIGRLLLYDALGATFTELKVRRDPECPICSRDPGEISDEEMGVFPDYEAFCAAAG